MFRNTLFLKLATIALLILLLLIPLSMVKSVVFERSHFKRVAIDDIANSWTGNQTVIAPLIVLPFTARHTETVWDKKLGDYREIERERNGHRVVMAESLIITGNVTTERRYRGIFSVPVYSADMIMSGRFNHATIAELHKGIKGFIEWGTPRLTLAVEDLRGIGANPAVVIQDKPQRFVPGTALPSLGKGIQAALTNIDLGTDLEFEVTLPIRGSQQLRVAPIADNAQISLNADWPHPKFIGRFLPAEREISGEGFTARWAVSSFSTDANDLVSRCNDSACGSIDGMQLGVSFIETTDVYTRTQRAAKYGQLFILLTFVAFFLTETLAGRKLHGVHYLLVGCSLVIFYLLLISLAEHIGFLGAYMIATVACTGLIGVYLSTVLASRMLAVIYAAGIAMLYTMLFMILRSEDFALLMGSLLLFAVLALVMLLTRRTDWAAVSESLPKRQPRDARE